MKKIFVYGTLRKGEVNAHLLKYATCIEENCWTHGLLFDSGYGYPALLPSATHRTVGELYEVTQNELKLLDELEDYTEGGTNNLYERVEQEVFTMDGVTLAFVYISNNDDLLKEEITSGNWKEYRLLKSRGM
ncbi:gamma-glutamylcyclotransferase [Lysinibacillus sp. SGAir0095]|uniref:gamma-glutamylcyclotransferase family protein n=1 Tax=Lysinibacillus sp. SGAir0095 TaxID=2070463 RepID=UPI0010CCDB15|nr:gamma-glutamylcyclotransferase [Lysinibacillus sp. SGAir0095]QCR32806.1 branched-chain alpha-keto acid dehydrogenase [Lysinibacillus sp. SGAir0095]